MPHIDFGSALKTAQIEGVLPQEAELPTEAARPWAVMLLSALGGWLVTIPVVALIGMSTHDNQVGLFFWALLLILGSVFLLRSKEVPLFLEQMAAPFLISGLISLYIAFDYHNDSILNVGAFVVMLVCMLTAILIHQRWLRFVLGMAAAVLLTIWMYDLIRVQNHHYDFDYVLSWLLLHLVLLLCLAALWFQQRYINGLSGAIESFNLGAILAVILGLAWWSGQSFMMGGESWMFERVHVDANTGRLLSAGSSVMAGLGAFYLLRSWPQFRRFQIIAIVPVMLGLAYVMPALGALLALMCVLLVTRRYYMSVAVALAAVWVVGAFYYQLTWTLSFKAAVLAGAGAILAVLSMIGYRSTRISNHSSSLTSSSSVPQRFAWGLGLSTLLILVVVNFSIWQKEQLIAHGRMIFVKLAPVDPRSLMQGDYMRLNFDTLAPFDDWDESQGVREMREKMLRVVLKIDARGVAQIVDNHKQNASSPDEVAVELVMKNGRPTMVTDAFYFKEGEGERWSAAQYGEFRVDDSGKALLVGLRDANLNPM